MSQKLFLPFIKAHLTASIDTDAYYKKFGFRHYGSDMISLDGNRSVYACGNGVVAATGWDNACGNVIVTVYPGAVNHRTGKIMDIAIRMYHLASVNVKVGQQITRSTKLGVYGATGKYGGTGPHLHMEADTDTKHVLYTPTVTASNYLRGTAQGAYPYSSSNNTVVNVMGLLYCQPRIVQGQSYSTAQDVFIRAEDKIIPILK